MPRTHPTPAVGTDRHNATEVVEEESGSSSEGEEEQQAHVVFAAESLPPMEMWARPLSDAPRYLPYQPESESLRAPAALLDQDSSPGAATPSSTEGAMQLPGVPLEPARERLPVNLGFAKSAPAAKRHARFTTEEAPEETAHSPGSPHTFGKVLFRPATVVIPEQADDDAEGEEDVSPVAPSGLSRKFKSAVMSVGVLASLRSMISPKSASGVLNSKDKGEHGIGNMLQRVRSSLALNASGVLRRQHTPTLPSAVLHSGYEDSATQDLMAAVKCGNASGVKAAIDAYADPNWADPRDHSMTPMHYVAAQGRSESHQPSRFSDETAKHMAQMLKKAGARMNTADDLGYVPLQLAAYHGNIGVLTFLLTSVGRSRPQLAKLLQHQDSEIKYTALHCAVEGHQARAVAELLMQGASYRVQDYTSLTPWSLCAQHHYTWGLSLTTELNIILADKGTLPADAVLQLALELRTLEAVPVVLRAAAKWPSQVWQLMRAAIASGLQEFVQLLAEDIAEVCPAALLEVPWGDVMVQMATRFPASFQTLVHGLNTVDFHSIVIPFIRGLNFDEEVRVEGPYEATTAASTPTRSQGSLLTRQLTPVHASHEDLHKHVRAKSIMSLKSMLVLGRSEVSHVEKLHPDDHQQSHGLPEAVKYLLLRCMVSSLSELDWRVWQAFVGGLHGSLALEIARFPKLFKRLTDSIAARSVPSWRTAVSELRISSSDQKSLASGQQTPASRWASAAHLQTFQLISSIEDYEKHKLLNVNHLVAAAIASRSSVNVYNIVTSMDRWLALNPSCYLAHLDPDSVAALASTYPEACRLLLSFEAQGQSDVKVPGHLCSQSAQAFRCSEFGMAFIWQDDGLVALKQLGISDLERLQRWLLADITFDTVLKLFKSAASQLCKAETAAMHLEALLNSGLTGKDINKLVQLDTSLSDVVASLDGGLSAGFVHQMLSHKISFQVVTEMLGVQVDRNTLWNNVRHQIIWTRFPQECYKTGITYEFIRIFFESWEEYHFDKRFIDLLFDFHDPLFVKLRTALEYVNSNKAVHVSLQEEEAAIQIGRSKRNMSTISILSSAFLRQQHFSPHRAFIVVLLRAGSALLPRLYSGLPRLLQRAKVALGGGPTDSSAQLHESPKIDAISETLPITNLAQLGHQCYLRALLSTGAPASTFGLPVVEALIQVKWSTYGFLLQCLLLIEHVIYSSLIVAYVLLINQGNGYCDKAQARVDDILMPDMPPESMAPEDTTPGMDPGTAWSPMNLFSCSQGITLVCLDGCLLITCAFQATVYVRQLRNLGLSMWFASPNNWGSLMTVVLQICLVVGHICRVVSLLQASVALVVLLQFLRLGWYAILNERLGALVRIITQTFADTMYFLFLLFILYLGFALAFLTLAPVVDPDDETPDTLTGGSLAIKLFTIMLGDITADFIQDKIIAKFALPGLSTLLIIIYTLLLLIVAFNMLVAIMNDTFNRIKSSEKNELLKLKALVLVDIEAGFSERQQEFLNRRVLGKYLHTLRPKLLDTALPDVDETGVTSPGYYESPDTKVRLENVFNHTPWNPRGPSMAGSALTHRAASRPGSAKRSVALAVTPSRTTILSQAPGLRPKSALAQGAAGAVSRFGLGRQKSTSGGMKSKSRAVSRQSSFKLHHGATSVQQSFTSPAHKAFLKRPSFVAETSKPSATTKRKSIHYMDTDDVDKVQPSKQSVAFMSDEDDDEQRVGSVKSSAASQDNARGEGVHEAIRDAQRRVTRMFTKRMTLGFNANTLMTPAEALKEAVNPSAHDDDEEDEEDDDMSWHEDEVLPLKPLGRISTNGGSSFQRGSKVDRMSTTSGGSSFRHGSIRGRDERRLSSSIAALREAAAKVLSNVDNLETIITDEEEDLPDYGDAPDDGYDSDDIEQEKQKHT